MIQFHSSREKESSNGFGQNFALQPKLNNDQSGHKYKQDTNVVAAHVMMMGERETLQMNPEEEDEILYPKLRMQPESIIQEVPMPAESSVNTLADNPESSRQGIRYDTGYDFSSGLRAYFQQGIVMTARSGYNVS